MSEGKRILFAVAPDGTGDGVPLVIFGISKTAWEYMKDGKTHHFDLTGAGVPVKVVLFGGDSIADIQQAFETLKKREDFIDARNTQFGIEEKPKKN